jgi:hypothetical protein
MTTTEMALLSPPKTGIQAGRASEAASNLRIGGTTVPGPAPAKKRRIQRRLGWLAAMVVVAAVAGVVADTVRDDENPSKPSGSRESTSAPLGNGPLNIGLPYENQPCNDQWLVILARFGDESAFEPRVRSAVDGIVLAKYLKNSESCEIFAPTNQGADMYQAYAGPFGSFQEACTSKLSAPRPTAWVRRLNLDSTRADLCFCLQTADELPVLRERHDGPWLPLDRSLVADVRYVLVLEGLNPAHRLLGSFTPELVALMRQYQSHHGVPTSGSIDKATWIVLQDDYCSG